VRLVIRRHTVLAVALALATASAWHLRATPVAAVVEPAATNDSYTATEDEVLGVEAPEGLLANDNPGLDTCVVSVDDAGLDGAVEFLPDG
jgi:hypothetical protein